MLELLVGKWGRTMDGTGSPSLPEKQAFEHYAFEFRVRARNHNIIANLILIIIVSLFGLSVYIFLNAQEIDKSKPPISTYKELELARISQEKILELAKSELEGLKREQSVGARTISDILGAMVVVGQSNERLNLINKKEDLLEKYGYYSSINEAKSKEEIDSQIFSVSIMLKDLDNELKKANEMLAIGELTKTDVTQVERYKNQSDTDLKILKSEAESARSANDIEGKYKDTDTITLIRTSLIRFGGVGVVLFLISILVPIYKHNIKLSAYYLARSDAISINSSLGTKNLKELTNILTPNYLFEKEPNTPLNEIARAISSLQK
ncbi:hypothetical protein FBZ89_11569 [Nitrospirillum amazonense]|uniref:Uncharacterized protein n=1 Tax=Nitrospirillum amazonense TaxID=28077 RepID=A0A560F0Y3_9PROT|nr:hypothetical protein [Nitrospirillum amazonense]TWB15290.1 hypothetical protein FBZ89_11569 [Nitrospirillum amazonense]